ncbi:MAG: hypothetical protein JWP58_1624 [Hymenobacter sp.]|nr:hypothetical protein [Hymenobacter sp.]
MKPLLLLLLTLLLKLPVAGPPVVRVMFSPLTKAAYLAAAKGVVVTKPTLTFPLKKVRGRIVIPTAKGPKVFQDKGVGTDDDDQAGFDYRGYSTVLKYHVVEGRYWEAFQCHLVGANGQQVSLPGLPEYSPDMQQFVVASAGIEVGFLPNSIQLFQLENGHWREVWKLEPSVEPATWEPDEIHWLSNSTLLLKKKMWTGPNPGNTFIYSRLTITP